MENEIAFCVEEWLLHLRDVKNYSLNTLNAYKLDVESFFIHAVKNNNGSYQYKNFIGVDNTEIRGWLLDRKNFNVSHRSNCRALSALKSFIRYLNKYRNFNNDKALSFNLRNNINSLPKPVSFEDILLIINSMESKSLWIKKRNQILIILLYGAGLRISEALNLKIGDISEGKSIKIYGKGRKERMVPLLDNVYIALKEYIAIAPFGKSCMDYIFCSARGTKLSRISVAKYLIDIRKKLGLEKSVSAHAFRHSFATHLINKDVDLRDIQELLGHADISTTEVYTKVETASLIDSYNKFHPSNE